VHEINLITTIALALGAALGCGLIARAVGLSPIVGYLVAGIIIGPRTPGFVGDIGVAGQLAEIGIILLMFGVGLHFSLKDLLAVRSIAVPGALIQSTLSTAACTALVTALGWDWHAGLICGIAISVASTVVLLRALLDYGNLDTPEGHAAVGWLVVEDIITVLVLVLLPPFGGSGLGSNLLQTIGLSILKLALLAALVLLPGARLVPWLLLRVARFRSYELFTLSILVIAICVATVAYVSFGASMALGAFLGGMVVGQSRVSEQAAADVLPMRNIFSVLFFVAVGMLFDFRIVLEDPLLVLGVLGVILVVKPLAALGFVLLGGHSLRIALTVAAGLAQVGEFSFIVAELARSLRLLPPSGYNVIVAGAIVSISLNPFLFRRLLALEPALARSRFLSRWLRDRSREIGERANKAAAERGIDPGAIVVGYGPVGQTVTRLLREFEINPVIVEMNVDAVVEMQQRGLQAIYGDATRREILRAAHLDSAAYLIVTIPHAEVSLRVIQAAREVAPLVRIFARASYINQADAFIQAGAAIIRYDEAESAAALAEVLLQDIDVPAEQITARVNQIRRELMPRRDLRQENQ
jgi:CPA2 family monovalent cation:H+ antiporter-2